MRRILHVVAALYAGMGASAALAAGCTAPHVEQATVSGVLPGGDLALADGRRVKLALLATDFGDPDHEAALLTALRELAVGQQVEIASGDGATDRHGRLSGLVRLPDSAEGATLQAELAGLGLALVRPEEAYRSCLPGLMAAEEPARAASLGLWARFPVQAGDVDAVRAMKGRFAIVEGRVLATGSSREVDYLNFGRVWRQDTTVRIPKASRAALAAAGLSAQTLDARQVRARGVIFESGGPAIEARWPEQLELEGQEGR